MYEYDTTCAGRGGASELEEEDSDHDHQIREAHHQYVLQECMVLLEQRDVAMNRRVRNQMSLPLA